MKKLKVGDTFTLTMEVIDEDPDDESEQWMLSDDSGQFEAWVSHSWLKSALVEEKTRESKHRQKMEKKALKQLKRFDRAVLAAIVRLVREEVLVVPGLGVKQDDILAAIEDAR